MSVLKLRAGLLGLLAILLLGAFSAAPAFAVGGPFCWHREKGEKTKGARITEAEPEEIAGHGGEQQLAGNGLLIESKGAQVKGIIYNNPDQCQAKVSIKYQEPIVIVGAEKNCEVKVNGNNVVKLFGHQAWKWDGTKKQLEEKEQKLQHRDWIFLPVELQQGATGLPKEQTFASLTITKKNNETCLPAINQLPVTGSATVAGFANPQISKENQNLGEWGLVEELRSTGGEGAQHFWNGKEFIGVQTGLKFNGAAKYRGIFEINTIGKQEKTPPQEIAYFEE